MSSTEVEIPSKHELDAMIPKNVSKYIHPSDKRNPSWAARKYAPEAYKQWLERYISYLFKDCQDKYDIEDALVAVGSIILKSRFLCVTRMISCRQMSQFYYFNDICWIETDEQKACQMLRLEIFDYLKTVNTQAAEFLMNEKFCRKSVKRIIFILSIPYNEDPQRNFRKFVAANGTLVYDENQEYVLRSSLPDDLEFSFNDVEVKDFTYDDPRVKTLLTWLNQIFADRNIVSNFLDNLRLAITGKPHKAIWYGTGDNSKTTMKFLVEKVFGDLIKISDKVTDEDKFPVSKDIVITNSLNKTHPKIYPIPYKPYKAYKLHHSGPYKIHYERFHFKGRWSDVADPDNGVYLRDCKFAENVTELAPTFLWLITHYVASNI